MDADHLIELRQRFNSFRRPIGFNYVHFLLIHLYQISSSSTIIQTYPLYSIYLRFQHKFHLNDDEQYQTIVLDVIYRLINENNIYLTETVEQTYLNHTTYPIACLFRLYSSMHLILFMEPLILLNHEQWKNFIQILFTNEYSNEKCDYIHFCIAHRKTKLIKDLLLGSVQQNEHEDNWLISKINSPSDRSWLPIHYAAYIADEELINKFCKEYRHLINPFHLTFPKSRQREFLENPFDYLLRASGMKTINSQTRSTIVHLYEENTTDNDTPLLPILSDDDDDDDNLLLTSPIFVEQKREQQTDSFLAEQHIQTIASDIPDADQLESSIQFSRDGLLRSLIYQNKGLVYFIPSPLLLASACPLNDENFKESYCQIIQILLDSKLVNIDGLNHQSLTRNTLEYFFRHKYANLTCTKSLPQIFYQCNALFISSKTYHPNRISTISNDEENLSKLIYFVTVLNQRTLFSQYEHFDQYLLYDLLDQHSNQIEQELDIQITLTRFVNGRILEQEQINDLTLRLLIRYHIRNEKTTFEIDIHYLFIDSYIDQFADTYISLFHTPITLSIENHCLSIVEILLSNISLHRTTHWGILAINELETCIDQLFSRRKKKLPLEIFMKLCSLVANISSEESLIQQRIFVHTLATCIRTNAKIEFEYLIQNYTKIFYDSCENHPTDIRHNILAYCVVRNQAQILESIMSAFSSLNYNSSELYMFPLSNRSSVTKDTLSSIFNDEKSIGTTASKHSIYSLADDCYRQYRRIRNTAIAKQQNEPSDQHHHLSQSIDQNLMNQSSNLPPWRSMAHFWHAVRLIQLNIRHRNQTNQYTQQINNVDDDQDRSITSPRLQTIDEEQNENRFHRITLEIPEPIFNEIPVTVSVAPKPVFISLISTDQEDEQEVTPVTGQTLLHIAAKLADHEDVVRVLISENTNMTSMINSDGQIPLLCAIQSGSTLSAKLLLEADPHSITTMDNNKSSVFHYCCERKNNVLLANMLNRLKRLCSNQSVRVQALQNLIEPNSDGQTPFSIACQKGSIKCLKQFFDSKWLLKYIQLSNLITSDGIKRCIDDNQLDIIIYLVSDLERFQVIISILIDIVYTEPFRSSTDIVVGRRQYNVLEYAILLKKSEFVKIFVSIFVPKTIEKKGNIDDHLTVVRSSNIILEEFPLYEEYKRFLTRYSLPFKNEQFNQTPIQRMLKNPLLVPYVPNVLDQFIDNDGMDLSVIDDCLCSKPRSSRCIFGHDNSNKISHFTPSQWAKEHPLYLISECDYSPIYDHPIVITTVNSKANLFGNVLYLFILIFQILYVALYTGVALQTRTPKFYGKQYVEFENETCLDMCQELTNSTEYFDHIHQETFVLNRFRFLLMIYSCIALFKELIQIVTQRGKYFREFFINLLEILTYTCGILFSIDLNSCSKYSSIRCKFQYDLGALGMASVWTILLLVFVNSLKLGKYGLLFITTCLTFVKFCFIYAFIWIGYLFAFHMLLTENPAFDTLLTSIPRMAAMLTGEFNYENLFYPDGKLILGTTMAKILFTTFVFVVHICVMNILIGLAVENVHDFQIHAKTENLRSRIHTVLKFQSKFGRICRTASKLMFLFGRYLPNLLSSFQIDVSKLTVRLKPVLIPTRTSNHIQCRVGYVTRKDSNSTASNLTHQKQTSQENYNEKLMLKVNEIQEEIHQTQLRFAQELHRLTIDLSKMIEK